MESRKLLECVPNFSEGRNMEIIHHITGEIKAVKGVDLLDIDAGRDANRTVVTFIGPPDEVVTAAFRAVKKASQLIDMRQHMGEHPRFGATDVCPLVPVSGLTMDDAVEYARVLARRIGEELQIPVYCYEYAALKNERKNLANSRSVEYEGLKKSYRILNGSLISVRIFLMPDQALQRLAQEIFWLLITSTSIPPRSEKPMQ